MRETHTDALYNISLLVRESGLTLPLYRPRHFVGEFCTEFRSRACEEDNHDIPNQVFNPWTASQQSWRLRPRLLRCQRLDWH